MVHPAALSRFILFSPADKLRIIILPFMKNRLPTHREATLLTIDKGCCAIAPADITSMAAIIICLVLISLSAFYVCATLSVYILLTFRRIPVTFQDNVVQSFVDFRHFSLGVSDFGSGNVILQVSQAPATGDWNNEWSLRFKP